jgi:hypothetical protein
MPMVPATGSKRSIVQMTLSENLKSKEFEE